MGSLSLEFQMAPVGGADRTGYRPRDYSEDLVGTLLPRDQSRAERLVDRDGSYVDPPTGHKFSPCDGRFESPPGSAHSLSRDRVGGLFLERDTGSRRVLSFQSHDGPGRHYWCFFGLGSDPLLLLLGIDAGADVLPHRDMGPREQGLCSNQVLYLHPGRRPFYAAGNPGPLFHTRPEYAAPTHSITPNCWAHR